MSPQEYFRYISKKIGVRQTDHGEPQRFIENESTEKLDHYLRAVAVLNTDTASAIVEIYFYRQPIAELEWVANNVF
ncbi:MAG: hypothetical protein ACSLEN_10160 [Candidatus Malihini olakiniferum]